MATRASAYAAQKARGSRAVTAYRSGLEEKIAAQLEAAGFPVAFEENFLVYTVPAREAKYTPDFLLRNGIIIESKGIFDADDRKKHLLIREQHPELDIRFVFSSSKSKLYKGSPTTYGMWCDKFGFLYADRLVPASWLAEPSKPLPSGVLKPKGATADA